MASNAQADREGERDREKERETERERISLGQQVLMSRPLVVVVMFAAAWTFLIGGGEPNKEKETPRRLPKTCQFLKEPASSGWYYSYWYGRPGK